MHTDTDAHESELDLCFTGAEAASVSFPEFFGTFDKSPANLCPSVSIRVHPWLIPPPR